MLTDASSPQTIKSELESLISDHYQAAALRHLLPPDRRSIRAMVVADRERYYQHCRESNLYKKFIFSLWEEILKDPKFRELARLRRDFEETGLKLYIGISANPSI